MKERFLHDYYLLFWEIWSNSSLWVNPSTLSLSLCLVYFIDRIGAPSSPRLALLSDGSESSSTSSSNLPSPPLSLSLYLSLSYKTPHLTCFPCTTAMRWESFQHLLSPHPSLWLYNVEPWTFSSIADSTMCVTRIHTIPIHPFPACKKKRCISEPPAEFPHFSRVSADFRSRLCLISIRYFTHTSSPLVPSCLFLLSTFILATVMQAGYTQRS